MNADDIRALLNDDPFAQELLRSRIPARLAYIALDGTPRAIPDGFEQQITALYDRMARIEVTPTWVKVLDFQTRAPETVMKLAAAKGM